MAENRCGAEWRPETAHARLGFVPNRLATASSPYLRQHADNPVDWYEWGPEAIARAAAEDKPIFLSVGYSSCHWCHVMAHESFEDAATAAVLNEKFVCIKVDREERPDIDSVYMGAVQALTGRGGWPMSVFTTPDGVPFYGGTYWPSQNRHGMPSFTTVLDAVSDAWANQRDEVVRAGSNLTQHLRAQQELGAPASRLDPGVADRAAATCVRAWDRTHGGFGGAPKFPQAMTIEFLLAHHVRTGDADALAAAVSSLEHMARGGIYDHVAGGFARYSVDTVWLVPHFEKMLYDNALLLRSYVHAWQVTRSPLLRRIATETADYLLRELQHPLGGFFCATDADAEGVEGKFHTWSGEEFRAVVAAAGQDPDAFAAFYGVSPGGNFSDPHHPDLPATTILHEPTARDEDDADFAQRLAAVRAALYEARELRAHPGLDDKVLASWNGLAIAALADAGAALGVPAYTQAAQTCAGFLRTTLRETGGRLLHTWRDGSGASVPAFLEDVAYLAQGLLVLFEADGDPAWLSWAQELAEDAAARFGDGQGAYFSTADDAEALLTRPKDLWDNATPGGASVLVDVHLRLASLTGEASWAARAEQTLGRFVLRAEQAPTGYGELLRGLERLLAGSVEVAVVGDPADPRARALLEAARSSWRPGGVLAFGAPDTPGVPLLAGRPLVHGGPAAYVCRNFACDLPVTDPASL